MKLVLSDEIFEKTREKFLEKEKFLLGLDADLEVCHGGGTSMKGILTRGDLDLLIRCNSEEQLASLTEKLKEKLQIKHPHIWSSVYSLFFEKDEFDIDYVVVLKGSPYGIRQQILKEKFKQESVREAYNELKRRHENSEYPEYAKDKIAFLDKLERENSSGTV